MTFKELLLRAKAHDEEARETLLLMYNAKLKSAAKIDGVFDDDLYQELRIILLKCIDQFQM